jgi:hypothetical protein
MAPPDSDSPPTLVRVYPHLKQTNEDYSPHHLLHASTVHRARAMSVDRGYLAHHLYALLGSDPRTTQRRFANTTLVGYDQFFLHAQIIDGAVHLKHLLRAMEELQRDLAQQDSCVPVDTGYKWIEASGPKAFSLLRQTIWPELQVETLQHKYCIVPTYQKYAQHEVMLHVGTTTVQSVDGDRTLLIVMTQKEHDPGLAYLHNMSLCKLAKSKRQWRREAECARLRNLNALALAIPLSPSPCHDVCHGAAQPIFAAIDSRENRGPPIYGWLRTSVRIIYSNDDETFTLTFTPPVFACMRNRSHCHNLCLRLRELEGEDLLTDVRINKMRMYLPCDAVQFRVFQDYNAGTQHITHVAVLRSITCPATFNDLSDTWYPEESNQLLSAVGTLWTRRTHAARVIQRAWRFAIACPYHPVCQRRLLREFALMSSPFTSPTSHHTSLEARSDLRSLSSQLYHAR